MAVGLGEVRQSAVGDRLVLARNPRFDAFVNTGLIGVVLSALGLDPWNIVESVQRVFRSIWNMGFDAVRWLWSYFLLGAVLVIPIWLILRIVRAPKGR